MSIFFTQVSNFYTHLNITLLQLCSYFLQVFSLMNTIFNKCPVSIFLLVFFDLWSYALPRAAALKQAVHFSTVDVEEVEYDVEYDYWFFDLAAFSLTLNLQAFDFKETMRYSKKFMWIWSFDLPIWCEISHCRRNHKKKQKIAFQFNVAKTLITELA